MTRSILYFLLILTFSCGNALPPQTEAPKAQPATEAAVTETPAPSAAKSEVRAEPEQPDAPKAAATPTRRPSRKPAVSQPATAPAVIAAAPQAETAIEAETTAPVPAAAEPAGPAPETETAAAPATEVSTSEATLPASGESSPGKEHLLALKAADADSPIRTKKQFLPTRQRIDREINKLKFAYKGEVMMGLTASYGTMSSDDTDIMLIIDGIDASGTMATVKPFIGYFYRDNNCLGVRFGYNHMGGKLNNASYDFGESNDTSGDLPKIDFNSDNYSFGIFHRSYAGLDPKGRFGLFAEFELSLSTGTSKFSYQPNSSSDEMKTTLSDNTQVKLAFNPGAAVYIFPNVCATLSFGLGGIQYTSVTQKDEAGNKIGSRKASNMKFKLNIAAINIGMTIHMWDKKKK